jgi:hypothetical protein
VPTIRKRSSAKSAAVLLLLALGLTSCGGASSARSSRVGTARAPAGAAAILDAKKVPAAVTTSLQRFTACMRSSGVPGFPEPRGAGFDLSATKLNPSSPQYKSAEAHCTAILEGADAQEQERSSGK